MNNFEKAEMVEIHKKSKLMKIFLRIHFSENSTKFDVTHPTGMEKFYALNVILAVVTFPVDTVKS